MKKSGLSENEIQQVEQIVRDAGEILLEYWPGKAAPTKSLGARKKADGSTVTDADIESNTFLLEQLRQLFPEDGYFSEETDPTSDLRSKDTVWVIDPLDGTWSFSRGRPEFSVLLSRVVGNRSVFGVVYLPALKEMFYGQVGHGAFRNGTKISVSLQDSIREGGLSTRNFPPSVSPLQFREAESTCFGVRELCTGRFDASVIRLKRHSEWDLAAYVALVEASGGRVSDEFGNEVKFYFQPPAFSYFVCSNGLVHDRALSLIPRAPEEE